MAEYKESIAVGTSYQRGRSLYFENPKSSVPSLLIREERITTLADRVITEPCGEILKTVDDLSVQFQMRNPQTNELIEGATMSYQDLYVALYSLYWALAIERDNAVPPNAIPPAV